MCADEMGMTLVCVASSSDVICTCTVIGFSNLFSTSMFYSAVKSKWIGGAPFIAFFSSFILKIATSSWLSVSQTGPRSVIMDITSFYVFHFVVLKCSQFDSRYCHQVKTMYTAFLGVL